MSESENKKKIEAYLIERGDLKKDDESNLNGEDCQALKINDAINQQLADSPFENSFRDIYTGEGNDTFAAGLLRAVRSWSHEPIQDKTLVLVNAAINRTGDPGKILPMAGLTAHAYQVFVFQEKLLKSGSSSDAVEYIIEMQKAEHCLDDLARIAEDGIRKYPELYRSLKASGLMSLDFYLIQRGSFDLDDGEMDKWQFYYRGCVNARRGRVDDAIRDFSSAIRLKANFYDVFFKRGLAFETKGCPEMAIQDYTSVLEHEPDHYWALCSRASMLVKLGEDEKALEDFDRAITIKPGQQMAYKYRAVLYSFMKKDEKAIEDLTVAIAVGPATGRLFYDRAMCYNRLGLEDRAKEDLQEAVRLGNVKIEDFLEKFPDLGRIIN